MQSPLHETSTNTNVTYHNGSVINGSKSAIRKDGLIFPSIKKKPSIINTTIVNDILALKDLKVSLFRLNQRAAHMHNALILGLFYTKVFLRPAK